MISMLKKTILFHNDSAKCGKISGLNKKGVKTVHFNGTDKYLSLVDVLNYLGDIGITSVMIEGGSELIGAAFDQGIVDKVYWFTAPIIIGGKDSLSSVPGLGAAMISDAVSIKDYKLKKTG